VSGLGPIVNAAEGVDIGPPNGFAGSISFSHAAAMSKLLWLFRIGL
jgi:hypothetical protein